MGFALPGRETPDRTTITTPADRVAAEARIVSIAYLAWPIAIYDRISPRADASQWYRFHLRQALWFGNVAAIAALFALLWPLLVSFMVANPTAIIWVYALAMIVDIALFVLWLVFAIRYSRRASQGELFQLSSIARLTGTKSQTP